MMIMNLKDQVDAMVTIMMMILMLVHNVVLVVVELMAPAGKMIQADINSYHF